MEFQQTGSQNESQNNESQTLIAEIRDKINTLKSRLDFVLTDEPTQEEMKEICGSLLIRDLSLIKKELESILNRLHL